MNNVSLTGNIGNEIELRTTQSGKYVCTLNLAVKDDFNKDNTDWITVVLWEKQAELVSQYLHKGSKIGVTGSIKTRQYQDKNGNKRTATEVLSRHIEFLDSRPTQRNGTPPQAVQPQYASNVQDFSQMQGDSDTLPF